MTFNGRSKAPTIKDVAKQAGVSFKTVSRVMNHHPSVNPKIRDAVLEAMQVLNYRPHQAARALRGQRSYSLALLTGWHTLPPGLFDDVQTTDEPRFSEFFSELIIGCSVACRKNSYHLIYEFLAYGEREQAEQSLGNLIDNLRPDGLILTPPLCDVDWLLNLLHDRKIRFCRLLPGTSLDRGLSFVIDDFGAGEAVSNLLLDAGHRKIAMIAGPADHVAANKRRAGFEAALSAIPHARCVVVSGNFTVTGGYERAVELLRSPDRPTAIFAANDAMAAGVVTAANELGLTVPEDLSVMGFDDTMIARLTNPPLTTVRQPVFDIARHAAEALIHCANTGELPDAKLETLDYSISERRSIAPPPSVT